MDEKIKKAISLIQDSIFYLEDVADELKEETKKEEIKDYINKLYDIFGMLDIM